MCLEMMAFRILPPNFGSSLYVWGSIISVFLLALTLGYYFGGMAADRLAIRDLVENWVVWRDSGDWERFRTGRRHFVSVRYWCAPQQMAWPGRMSPFVLPERDRTGILTGACTLATLL